MQVRITRSGGQSGAKVRPRDISRRFSRQCWPPTPHAAVELARHAGPRDLCPAGRRPAQLPDRFGDRALIRTVPPDDFNQELADPAAVKEYCAMTFDLTPPLTRITHAVGETAHPLGRAKRPAASPAGTSTRC